jgi:hypothetical protein
VWSAATADDRLDAFNANLAAVAVVVVAAVGVEPVRSSAGPAPAPAYRRDLVE